METLKLCFVFLIIIFYAPTLPVRDCKTQLYTEFLQMVVVNIVRKFPGFMLGLLLKSAFNLKAFYDLSFRHIKPHEHVIS